MDEDDRALVVLTDGYDLYERVRRGVYHRLNRQGRRMGALCSDFQPRPRWKHARLCEYDARVSLTCERCGAYDNHYAVTGDRSYCRDQGKGVVI